MNYDKFVWKFFRRLYLEKSIVGFSASIRSYCDKNSRFSEWNKISSSSEVIQSCLGRFTYLARASVKFSDVGSFCSIGPDAMVGGLGKHPVDWMSTHPAFFSTKMQSGSSFVQNDFFEEIHRTTLGSDVWIGARAIVLDGISIGNGAVVAANSVVTNDVDAFSVVGGVPAKTIKMRFEDKVIELIQRSQWWDKPEKELELIAKKSNGGKDFIRYLT